MTLNLRDHFDRAVGDDPGPALGEMAAAAIVEGGRLRRRRSRRVAAGVAAGVVVVVGAVAGLNLAQHPDPPVTLAAAMRPVSAPACLPDPVTTGATDVVVVLAAGVTGARRAALDAALRDDPRVAALMFETREQAYQRFRTRWADNPDLVDAVRADQFPASVRLRLRAAGQYTGFRARFATMDGVESIIGRRCAADAPVGGVL